MENQFGNQPSAEEATKAEEVMTEEQKEKIEKMKESLKWRIGMNDDYGMFRIKLKGGRIISPHKITEVRDDVVILERYLRGNEIPYGFEMIGPDVYYSRGGNAGERVKDKDLPYEIMRIPFKEIDGFVVSGGV